MKIYELNVTNTDEFDEKDFLNYLSQVILSLIDEEVNQLKQKLISKTNSLANINKAFKDVKKNYETETSEYAKERQLKRVLQKIETLNKEGSIRGARKTSIINILPKLKNYTFQQLIKFEENLTLMEN